METSASIKPNSFCVRAFQPNSNGAYTSLNCSPSKIMLFVSEYVSFAAAEAIGRYDGHNEKCCTFIIILAFLPDA
jgi:hypothetical protein